ncbi:hypothetical protein C7271_26665 [filamentous cyanobacterium CCP5]|nr:hypothetical protein C7271_26665 [filamentous cyanobacterium CCP5]
MAQILDPIPSDSSGWILCCYLNATSKIQIARITNIQNWYFERVVFPGQRLVFETTPNALLEIHTGMMASAILSDTIPCGRLMVDAPDNSAGGTSETSEEAVSAAPGESIRPTAMAVAAE